MRELTYYSDYGSILLSAAAPYILQRIELPSTKNELTTERAYKQDGVSITDEALEPIPFKIYGAIVSQNLESQIALRRALTRIFSPKSTLKKLIYAEGENHELEINCAIEEIYFDTSKSSQAYLPFTIDLFADKPFWTKTYNESELMKDFVGGFAFKPLVLPTTFAIRGDNTIIDNQGDVPTPLTIKFYGGATNPIITNETTGEFIKVISTIAADKVLIITTEFGNKTVVIKDINTGTESNAMGLIDLDSTFFSLEVGENVLSYSTDAGVSNVTVALEWRERYLQV